MCSTFSLLLRTRVPVPATVAVRADIIAPAVRTTALATATLAPVTQASGAKALTASADQNLLATKDEPVPNVAHAAVSRGSAATQTNTVVLVVAVQGTVPMEKAARLCAPLR